MVVENYMTGLSLNGSYALSHCYYNVFNDCDYDPYIVGFIQDEATGTWTRVPILGADDTFVHRMVNWHENVVGPRVQTVPSGYERVLFAWTLEPTGLREVGMVPQGARKRPSSIGPRAMAAIGYPSDAPQGPGLYLYRFPTDGAGWAGPIQIDPSITCMRTAVAPGFVACAPATGPVRVYDTTALPDILPTPQPLTPADGQQLATVPTLTWSPVPGARSYTLEYARTPTLFGDGAELVRMEGIIGTSQTLLNLPADVTYYWRVWAEAEGTGSAWSPVRSFVSGATAPTGVPSLVAPSNGSTQAASVSLQWQSVVQATGYQIQIARSPDFASPVEDRTVGSTQTTIVTGLERGVMHHWRVRGLNALGEGPWSVVHTFRVRFPTPAAVTLLVPANGEVGIDRQSTFSWTATEWAAEYDLQFAHSPDFNPLVLVATAGATEWAPEEPFNPNRFYFWRVRGANVDADGPWSTTYTFTTGTTVDTEDGPPTEFALSAPHPNPARGTVTLGLDLPEASRVRVAAFDALGREVGVLADGALAAGRHALAWAAMAPAGVYVVRAQVWPGGAGGAAGHTFTQRLAVVR